MLKTFLLAAAILVLVVAATAVYLVRGGFRDFAVTRYQAPPAGFTNWNDVLAHPRDISLTTFRTGVVHMDACLNLDPASPKQSDCDHRPRDLAVLVHWVHHPRFGDFLIDAGFDDSFRTRPPYGSYTAAMKLFNWLNGVSNRQEQGEDLRAQLARLKVRPKAVFFTHLHPDHTAGVPSLPPETELVFGSGEASFLARAAVANHFSGKSKVSGIDFAAAPTMAPVGHSVDLFGDGSFWAISAAGHTDDDVAYLINGAAPILLTGDASHFAWAFQNGVAPRGWNAAGTARGYLSLEQLRAFARTYPSVTVIFGHEAQGPKISSRR
jgi:glyoxylase-like metal-dependent hydrolase (beta-lactamase superfamily II)